MESASCCNGLDVLARPIILRRARDKRHSEVVTYARDHHGAYGLAHCDVVRLAALDEQHRAERALSNASLRDAATALDEAIGVYGAERCADIGTTSG